MMGKLYQELLLKVKHQNTQESLYFDALPKNQSSEKPVRRLGNSLGSLGGWVGSWMVDLFSVAKSQLAICVEDESYYR